MAALASLLLSHLSLFLSTLYWSLWHVALCQATVQSQPTCWIEPFLKADLKINRFVTGVNIAKQNSLCLSSSVAFFFHVSAFIRHALHLNAILSSSAFVSPLSAVMPQCLKCWNTEQGERTTVTGSTRVLKYWSNHHQEWYNDGTSDIKALSITKIQRLEQLAWQLCSLLSMSPSRSLIPKELLLRAKQDGFSDRQIAQILGSSEKEARELRLDHGVKPWVKQVSVLIAGGLKTTHGPQNDSSVPS